MIPGFSPATGFGALTPKQLLVSRIAAIAGGLLNIMSLGVASDATLDTHGGTSTIATTGTASREVAFTPDGTLAYVVNYVSNSVTKIVVATGATSTIAVGTAPNSIAITPDGLTAYVVNTASTFLTKITIATDATANVAIGSGTNSIAISPGGLFAYVTNASGNFVTKLILATEAVSNIPVGLGPRGLAFSPDGTIAYVAAYSADVITRINVSDETTTSFSVVTAPFGVAFSPDGTLAYVISLTATTMTRVVVATQATTQITVGATQRSVRFSPDGTIAYITIFNTNLVSRVNVSTNLVTTIPVGVGPWGVAFSPDGTFAYASCSNNTTTRIVVAQGIATMPALVGATLTPASTGRAALQTVNGYLAAVFAPQPAACGYSLTGVAKTVFAVAMYTAPLPDPAITHVVANPGVSPSILINAGTTVYASIVTMYYNGAPGVGLVVGSPHTVASVRTVNGSPLAIGCGGSAASAHNGPIWAWCYLLTEMPSTQIAQIHTAFKEFFKNLGLP